MTRNIPIPFLYRGDRVKVLPGVEDPDLSGMLLTGVTGTVLNDITEEDIESFLSTGNSGCVNVMIDLDEDVYKGIKQAIASHLKDLPEDCRPYKDTREFEEFYNCRRIILSAFQVEKL